MTTGQALASGLAGAVAVNFLHELARQVLPHAPRMEVIGMRALAKLARAADQPVPPRDQLYWLALAADILSNGLYYSLVAADDGDSVARRGVGLGLAAGVGGAILPAPLGLGRQPGARWPQTQLLTVAWYTAGGMVAAAIYRRLTRR